MDALRSSFRSLQAAVLPLLAIVAALLLFGLF